ncbi:MAG: FkbM family methyltransferase [Gemmobacter sp.]
MPFVAVAAVPRKAAGDMARYTLNTVDLQLPDTMVTGQLDQALTAGRYEHTEAEAIGRHLRPRDRFLDLGAGAGYLISLAARLGAAGADGVEANPDMVPVATANLARNGGGGTVVWGAVVPDGEPAATLAFTQRRSFWASSLTPPADVQGTRKVEVPALRFAEVLARFDPTVMCIDIEGGEAGLIAGPLPPALRLIVMELHPAVYGGAGIRAVFDAASAQGFGYCPAGSKGGTVVFQRVA